MLVIYFLLCALGGVIGQSVPPCEWPYVEVIERRGELMGRIKVKDPGGDNMMTVKLYTTLPVSNDQLHFGGLKQEYSRIKNGVFIYYLQFPVKCMMPIVSEVTFNGRVLCKGEDPPPGATLVTSYTHAVRGRTHVYMGTTQTHVQSGLESTSTSLSNGLSGIDEPTDYPLRPTSWLGNSEWVRQHGRTTTNLYMPHTIRVTSSTPPSEALPPAALPPAALPPFPPPPPPPPPPSPPTAEQQGIPDTSMINDARPTTTSSTSKKVTCGLSIQPVPLTYGGREVERGSWPWVAALFKEKDMTFICGCTLLNKKHVIIAAHCVKHPSKGELSTEDLVVVLGKFDISKWSERDVIPQTIESIVIHPEYNPATLTADIAILVFDIKCEYTNYVRPICLWDTAPDPDTILNVTGKVVGWGEGDVEPLTAYIPILSQDKCIDSNQLFRDYVSNRTLCGGFVSGTTPCMRDGGGGLLVSQQRQGGNLQWYLRGVFSLALQTDQDTCDPNEHTLYTDVVPYMDWIRAVLSENESN